MDLFIIYLWIQVIYAVIAILVLLAVLVGIIMLIRFARRTVRKAARLASDTQEKIASAVDRFWFLRIFAGEDTDG